MVSNEEWVSLRRAARVYMVQAAFCIVFSGMKMEEVEDLKCIFDFYDQGVGPYDQELFYTLFYNFVASYESNDQIIKTKLVDNWDFERFDPVVLSIIRVAVCEILSCPETSSKVIVSEYVTMAGCFVLPEQVDFINAMLDKLRKESGLMRPGPTRQIQQ